MYGLQEILSKTEEQRRNVKRSMERLGGFNYQDANIYQGLKSSVENEIRKSMYRIPLKEFLIAGSTKSNYLIADKLASILYRAAQPMDLATLISADVINGWEGGDLTVDITDRYSLKARRSGSGGSMASVTPETEKATLSPVSFNVPLIAESSMIEDSAYALVEWYVKQAAYAIAEYSNDLVLDVLKTATDGVGTVNSSATGNADETKWQDGTTSDIEEAIEDLSDDEWIPDTMVVTPQAWRHSIYSTMGAEFAGGAAGDFWQPSVVYANTGPPAPGFHLKVDTMDVFKCTSPILHDEADARGATMTECVTILFDRTVAILTGRKRWLLIEDFVNPIEDLEGAVVSSRQATISLYDDAIYVLTET